MAELKQVTTEKENAGKRLDLYLVFAFPEISRSFGKQLIANGKVKINGEVEFRPHYKMKAGDTLRAEIELKNTHSTIIPQDLPLNIIYEDADLLVVNKPAGLTVHPATGNWQGTLMNAVLFHFRELKEVGDTIRSGLIHRLDKDTSGIVLIGKSSKGLWHYSKQFAERKVEKSYLAVCAGNVKNFTHGAEVEIRNYLGRNPVKRKKIAVVNAAKGRLALTKIKALKIIKIDNKEYSLVLAVPHTGRTHQIRVHLSTTGYPVLGDKVYGKGNDYKRLMLHAWKLSVRDPDGGLKTFTAQPTPEFKPFL